VVLARVVNPIARILLPRRNALSVVKWVIYPQIARIKMKIILARRRSLKERRNCLRSTIRRKMVRHAMLSGIRIQV
jgi:tmRNA-binding protein